MHNLMIKRAKLINEQLIDILVLHGKIAAIGQIDSCPSDVTQHIDFQGHYYLSAGWIDAHTHCFSQSPLYYDEPDLAGSALGVTSMVDAGSVGARDIAAFEQASQRSKTNVYAFLNIAQQGIISQDELSDMRNVDADMVKQALAKHPDFVVGLKARMSKSVVGNNGIQPLVAAKKMQQMNQHVPLMVHIGNSPPNLDDIAALLTEGDIITHCFNGKPNCILTPDGQLKSAIKAALARGVILDVGHGGESFSFKVAEQAMRIGTYPDLISSDIYHRNRIEGPVYSLAAVMTKFLCMGFSLKQVLDCVTEKAATLLKLPNKGRLVVGADADFTLFTLENEKLMLTDAHGEVREGHQRIDAKAVIIGGEWLDIDSQLQVKTDNLG